MATTEDLLRLIPEGAEYDILRWTIERIARLFPQTNFTAERVIGWVTEITEDGGRNASQIRSDILEVMVTKDVLMEAYSLTSEEADKVISGETTLGSLGEIDPYVPEAGQDLNSVPGKPEVWVIDGQHYLVYTVPGLEPPVYISWLVEDQKALESLYGPDQEVVVDRTMSQAQADALGLLYFGNSAELENFDADPFATWVETLEIQAQSQPWILDPDYQALIAMAILEGRELTDAEIQSTEWWRSHTEAEREWMKMYHGDPESAEALIQDNRIRTRTALQDAGMENPSEEMVNFMADHVSKGTWTSVYYLQQIEAVADPYSGITIDSDLAGLVGEGAGVTHEGELDVESLIKKWLGPVHGEWDQAQIEEWAGRIRNDPDIQAELIGHLKSQRLALFPGYENENLTYNDIASPWKSFVSSIWGQTADETDPMFATLLKNNDSTLNAQLLRSEGFKQGIGKVTQDAQSELLSSTGGSVRRALN